MASVLVTGASGFLGRHVCRELSKSGDRVFRLARDSRDRESGWINIPNKPTSADIRKIIDQTQPSIVYHLAGTSQSANVPALYEANVFFAEAVLSAAANCSNPPKVLLVGSAAEYGKPICSDMVVREGDECRPFSAYGISKLAQTHHGLAASLGGLEVSIARLFNPIGVGSPASSALGSFVKQIAALGRKGGVLRTGSLNAIRDFVDVADAARAVVSLPRAEGTKGRVFNISTGAGMRLQDIVSLLIEVADVPITHQIDEARRGTSDLDTVIGSNERLGELGICISRPDIRSILHDMLFQERSALPEPTS